jgi:sodium transport system ATP-binding protein
VKNRAKEVMVDARHQGISVAGLGRTFGELEAVKDVHFDVVPGEVVGLLGPNGAGKTTTLRMLATLLEPSVGGAFVGGHDIRRSQLEVRASVGYLTGDTGLYARLTPEEVLTYFGELHGMSAKEIDNRLEEVIALLHLEEFARQRCDTLSTGQKQRVSIARTVFHDPKVLILDEPTSGLDILAARDVLRFFRSEADGGKAVLISTHILAEVDLICDRAAVIHHGEIRHYGTLTELATAAGCSTFSGSFFRLLGEGTEA